MLTPRENMLLVYQHKVPEYLPIIVDIEMLYTLEPGLKSVAFEGKTASIKSEVDWFGQNWIYEPKIKAHNPDAGNYVIKDITKWRDYVTLPDLDATDWKARFIANGVKPDGNKLFMINDRCGLWERAFAMIPIVDLLSALIVEPEACEDFFHAIAEHKIKLHSYYIEYCKPDCLRMHDDYGSGQGLFMSPETWRSLIKPHLQRVIDNATSKGVMYEQHCCGYMAPLAEEIAAMGASSWNNVHISNDPYACKQTFGEKIALIGGSCNNQYLDTVTTTEEQIRKHIREVAEKMLPGAGVVISAGFPSHPERGAIFNDELLKYGQQFFKQARPV